MTLITRIFQFSFSKPDRTYQGGDVIDGYLFVNIKSRIQFKQIVLKIVGKSQCYWTEGRYVFYTILPTCVFHKHPC